ncbi:peptide-methionine (S)-S-oxide reductase MsrA [Marinobacterium arenosum]|uniref:peptide-methionine (S)-S-oxide reductase MsrA n=1 Tax=Marinobacterium arenosum TaxID=2862496 RepID=UPI001C93E57F|nr:peptide-methionine (S)-S-oxide reductase MsrA [Marinobacterium arenosum]MBY4675211.1 peptide-methionine (S)-S-oxide reductase MsrA [Marinobacterium arenosum]
MKSTTLLLVATLASVAAGTSRADQAIFAGGCFWCMEEAFQKLDGVSEVISGFTGGTLENPTYDGNHEGHYEAVQVTYDPKIITYQQLLKVYWRNIDPFDDKGQFCDKGHSYLSAIFVADDEQRRLARVSKEKVIMRFADQTVVTPILAATTFYPVKAHHQDYYLKNPWRYKFYKAACRRTDRLEEIWGRPEKH